MQGLRGLTGVIWWKLENANFIWAWSWQHTFPTFYSDPAPIWQGNINAGITSGPLIGHQPQYFVPHWSSKTLIKTMSRRQDDSFSSWGHTLTWYRHSIGQPRSLLSCDWSPSCSVQCAAWAPQSMQIIIISALQEIELPSSGQTSWNEMDVKLDWGWKYPLVLIAGFVTVDETQRLCHVSIQASSLNWRKHATENCQLSKAHCWLVNWQCSILLIGFRNALFVEFL